MLSVIANLRSRPYCLLTIYLGDEMNPKRVYGSYTLLGVIVVRVYDPSFRVHRPYCLATI